MSTIHELLPALQFTPPVISLDFDTLEARIDEITATYTGLVVQEDDVPAIKNELAGLNKLAKHLGDARKEAVSKVSGPIKEFEGQVKGLEKRVLDTRSFLDEQVKAHIQRERDGRRARVQCTIDILKDDHGAQALDIPIQENWLNKTITDKQITSEVESIILRHMKEEADRLALEQAKQDRLTAIEGHNKAMAQNREFTLPVSTFVHLQSLDIPLQEVMQSIEASYQREDERRAPKPEPKVEPKPAPHFTDMPEQVVEPEVKPIVKTLIITATYSSDNAGAVGAAFSALKDACMTISKQIQEQGQC